MCTPDALSYFSMGTSAVGSIAGAYTATAQGRAQAELANIQAQQLREEALQRAAGIRKAATSVRGQARAAYAASGVKVDTGTPDEIDTQILRDSETDAQRAILTGERRARSAEAEGAAARAAGKARAAAALTEGTGTVLSGLLDLKRWRYRRSIMAGEVF